MDSRRARLHPRTREERMARLIRRAALEVRDFRDAVLVLLAMVACGAILAWAYTAHGQPAQKCEDALATTQELLASARNARDVYEAQMAQAIAQLKAERAAAERVKGEKK